MKYQSIIASIIAYAATIHSFALAQGGSINPGGPEQPCTFTATPCAPPPGGDVKTSTVYEVSFVATATQSFDCQGCTEVTVIPRDCYGHGPVIETTTFVVEPESTTTVDVCSPTPN
ncbi:hypothetical protein HO173_011880 [Letharia columbiana]|uniref:Uncharacterized protein n=1 Tax=Letharia columbiana TaxID=112416 RepID=A0A8H6FHB2_9LECA|nr:uncharacterized protein HO173_011880 [Letharia columbiana]KAF6228577.1 hypothetical protein HO173_011880 [Letharia columbiana]